MKTSDKMLLHSLDAVTPGGLPNRRDNLAVLVIKACTYVAVFLLGVMLGVSR